MQKLTIARQRTDFVDWYRENRRRSASLFEIASLEAYYAKPIPLRHPIIFYEGHLPAFSYNTLVKLGLGGPAIDARMEQLFARGIDPADQAAADRQGKAAWPSRAEVSALAEAWDQAVERVLQDSIFANGANSNELAVQAAYTILEHEQMHHETLLYIMHRLPAHQKVTPAGAATAAEDGPAPAHHGILIPTGSATLGAHRNDSRFGWDNEFEAQTLEVPAFAIDAHSVTNGDYLEFVQAGGPPPSFWIKRDDQWCLQAMFAEIPLPKTWPVYATHDQAVAYARWKGMGLPTEAEYQRAAYGGPDGEERDYPWGGDPPEPRHGNFNFQRWDPLPAGSRPAGASAWGVHDLIGNGWEWTDTPFGPLPGFAPMRTYPQYSSDFFDGRHYVVKGASPATSRDLIRRSFRNWYRSNYPYIYAKFRRAQNA